MYPYRANIILHISCSLQNLGPSQLININIIFGDYIIIKRIAAKLIESYTLK